MEIDPIRGEVCWSLQRRQRLVDLFDNKDFGESRNNFEADFEALQHPIHNQPTGRTQTQAAIKPIEALQETEANEAEVAGAPAMVEGE